MRHGRYSGIQWLALVTGVPCCSHWSLCLGTCHVHLCIHGIPVQCGIISNDQRLDRHSLVSCDHDGVDGSEKAPQSGGFKEVDTAIAHKRFGKSYFFPGYRTSKMRTASHFSSSVILGRQKATASHPADDYTQSKRTMCCLLLGRLLRSLDFRTLGTPRSCHECCPLPHFRMRCMHRH